MPKLSFRCLRLRWCAPAIALLGAVITTSGALAACTSGQVLSVGDIAKDHRCNFNTIQQAIDAALCPGTTILISRELTYTAQHLSINDKDALYLQGAAHCGIADSVSPAPQTTIDGTGHTGDSVIGIKGKSTVAFSNLRITGGREDSDGHGGGVFYEGQGVLDINNTTILNNYAGYGGGIYMHGDAGLFINNDVQIQFNTAEHSGGGIYLEGDVHLALLGKNATVYANVATQGSGGGIAAVSPVAVSIGSPGVDGVGGAWGLGAVDSNSAVNGAGIALLGNAKGSACSAPASLQMFTLDPKRPVQVNNNTASGKGGALYLRPNIGFGLQGCSLGGYAADLHDARLANNSASDGAAAYLDSDDLSGIQDLGSNLGFNALALTQGIYPPANYGAVACSAGFGCNSIVGNFTQTSDGRRTNGAVILVGTSSSLYASRIQMTGNASGNLVRILGNNDYAADTRLYNSLFTDNAIWGELLFQQNDKAPVVIHSSTIANNTIGSSFVLRVNTALTLADSIISQEAEAPVDYTGPSSDLKVANLLANDTSGLPISSDIVQENFSTWFVDPLHGNYHLYPSSIPVDFAPAVGGGLDFDGNPREVDTVKFNVFGPRDLGALEVQ